MAPNAWNVGASYVNYVLGNADYENIDTRSIRGGPLHYRDEWQRRRRGQQPSRSNEEVL